MKAASYISNFRQKGSDIKLNPEAASYVPTTMGNNEKRYR